MTSIYLPPTDTAAYIASATSQATAITNEAIQWTVIQVALMAAQRATRTAISDMQEKLANRRMLMAEKALAHAQETWPAESAYAAEAFAEAKHTPDYTFVPIITAEVDRVEGLAQDQLDAMLAQQGLAFSACDQARGERAVAQGRTDLIGHAMRSAEAKSVAYNDRRYSRQLNALGLGRGRLQNGITFGSLTAGGDAVRTSLLRTINSGMELYGYTTNRWTHSASFVSPRREGPTVAAPDRMTWGGWAEPAAPAAPIEVKVNLENFADSNTGGAF